MISDTLSECVTDLDHYLDSPTFEGTYEGELRDRIIRLRNEAEYIRLTLDVPPDCPLPPESVLLERIDQQRSRKKEGRSLLCAGLRNRRPRMAAPKKTGLNPHSPDDAANLRAFATIRG
jgi:hypothetical protein